MSYKYNDITIAGGYKQGEVLTANEIAKVDDYSTKSQSPNFDEHLKLMFNMMHPVGSVYISVNNTPPQLVLADGTKYGTWEKFSDGYSLWSASSNFGGTNAGSLPKIEGSVGGMTSSVGTYSGQLDGTSAVDLGNFTGAFSANGSALYYGTTTNANWDVYKSVNNAVKFSAASSNSTYGASAGANIVRPTSINVAMYKRIS